MGNTCYMNATLQMVIHVRPEKLLDRNGVFGKQLGLICDQIEKNQSSLLPVSFKKVVDKNMAFFKGNDQHDAHEFLMNILDKLEV